MKLERPCKRVLTRNFCSQDTLPMGAAANRHWSRVVYAREHEHWLCQALEASGLEPWYG